MSMILNRGMTITLGNPGLAAGTTNTVTISGFVYGLNGRLISRVAQTNFLPPLNDINTGQAFRPVGPSRGCVFVYGSDLGGGLRVMQSAITPLDAGNQFVEVPDFPPIPGDVCPFAYMILRAGANAAPWIHSVHNQSGVAGVTYDRVNIVTLPARPQMP